MQLNHQLGDQMQMDDEQWRPISGLEGEYEVSSLGRVRSLPRVMRRKSKSGTPSTIPIPGKIMSPPVHQTGYLVVYIRGRKHYVHDLVLSTFFGPRPAGMVCRHADGNRINPRLDNLSWGTRLENVEDARKHGTFLRGETASNAKLTEAQALKILTLRGTLTNTEIARLYNLKQPTISNLFSGATWKHLPRS